MIRSYGTSNPARWRRVVLSLTVLGVVLLAPVSAGAAGTPTQPPAIATPHGATHAVTSSSHGAVPRSAPVHPSLPSTPASQPVATSSTYSPPNGHLPASWAGSTAPPGGEALARRYAQASSHGPAPLAPHPGNGSAGTAPDGDCYGIWPAGDGQKVYANNCYGHDEPGIQFYSTLHGSGGNTTWSVTLPTGRDYADTQADLYAAIWFGMTLTDPYAWGDQCFLELQFYPDSDWFAGGLQPNSWVGAAVAWQIEAANGFEDTCFYTALYQNGTGFNELLMHGGDQIVVTMSGWAGSTTGETLSIVDVTNGESSWVQMYNSAQGYPINPAYDQNAFENGLQWTPGGEYPVVFAFETGHTIDPYPNTNGYGGCSAGPPPPSARNPDVPCPSYDPGSWVNDTMAPWQIQTPTFFNRTAVETPTQVSFSQDLGGISFIDPISNGTCNGLDGSAWCSYPWYSYSCNLHAFEYGATNYPGVTTDFTGYRQFSPVIEMDAAQYQYYPPTNFSIPTCAGPSYNVSVFGDGGASASAYFLSTPVPDSLTFSGVAPGEYSIAALPSPTGFNFTGWTVTGNVSVVSASDPSTTLWVTGDGTVIARYSNASATLTTLSFHSATSGGRTAILADQRYTTGSPLATLGNLGTVSLAPGVYSLQAYAPSGSNFTGWKVSGDGASLASLGLPFTWLDIPSAAASVSLTATFSSTGLTELVVYGTLSGNGNVSFNGGTPTTSGTSIVGVGTYSISALPAAGWAFQGWYYFSSAIMIDFTANSSVTVEGGTTDGPYAEFSPLVRFNVTPGTGGAISVNGGAALSTQSAFLDSAFNGWTELQPAPGNGYAFTGWTVSSPSALWVFPVSAGIYYLVVNASGTVTAHFATATTVLVSFQTSPANVGKIEFNFADYSLFGSAFTLSVAAGTYAVAALPHPGYNFTGWTTSSASISGSEFTVGTTAASLTAHFVVGTFPVTFTTIPPNGPTISVSAGIGPINTAHNGQTLWLSGLTDTLTAQVSPGQVIGGWSGSANIVLGPGLTPTLAIEGPGTVGLFTSGFSLAASLSPNGTIDLGQSVTVRAYANGTGPFTYVWSGLPTGCTGPNLPTFSCRPSVLGNFTVQVNVTAADGTSHMVVAGTLDIRSPLAVLAFGASPVNFTLGSTTTFTAQGGGGTLPYTYQYSGLPSNCPSVDQASFTCTPSLEGRYDVNLRLSDVSGSPAVGFVEINVFPTPAIQTFFANRTITDLGLPVGLTVLAGGGTGPLSYQYSGLPPGCVGANVTNLTCAPTTTGNYTITVNATDLDGFAASQSLKLSVVAAPSVAQFTMPTSAQVNQTFSISVTPSGGLAPYTYLFSGLPAPCSNGGASSFYCRPAVAGNYTVNVTVVDHLGVRASAQQTLSVQALPPPPPTNSTGTGATVFGLPVTIAIALLAAIAVVAVAAVLLYRRRTSRRPSEADAPGDDDARP